MTLTQAIDILESSINCNKDLIEELKTDYENDDFRAFIEVQNKAFKVIYDYLKASLN